MKLRDTEWLYVRSMGKLLRVTAIFESDAEANAFMSAHSEQAVVACFGKYILLADQYDKGLCHRDLISALQLAKTTIERLDAKAKAPSAMGTLDVLRDAIAKVQP